MREGMKMARAQRHANILVLVPVYWLLPSPAPENPTANNIGSPAETEAETENQVRLCRPPSPEIETETGNN